MNAAANVCAERALELPERDADKIGKLLARQWFFDIFFHGRQRGEDILIRYAEAKPKIHSLRSHTVAYVGVQKPIADRRSELVAVIAANESRHHVEPGDPAGAGNAVAGELK